MAISVWMKNLFQLTIVLCIAGFIYFGLSMNHRNIYKSLPTKYVTIKGILNVPYKNKTNYDDIKDQINKKEPFQQTVSIIKHSDINVTLE